MSERRGRVSEYKIRIPIKIKHFLVKVRLPSNCFEFSRNINYFADDINLLE